MRLALTGLCIVMLTACGDGLFGLGKKVDEPTPPLSADAEPGCSLAGSGAEDVPAGNAEEVVKKKKGKPDKANNGRKKEDGKSEDEDSGDEPASLEAGESVVAEVCPPESEVDVPVSTASVSFVQGVAPIMNASCVTCHSASRADGGIALDTLDAVRSAIDASIASIESGRMPIGGVPAVSQEQVDLLKQWKATGFGD